MSILTDHTVLPPADQASGVHDLAAALAGGREFHLVDESGHTFPLTIELQTVLARALAALNSGQAVTLEPLHTLLSTQEAANLLGVSRPTLVKLLESDEIPFTKPGRHRRVQLQHLLDYQRRQREHRREELATMTAEAAHDDAYHTINGFTRTR
ncbi:helix-turn-helix domain-containing protein [Mycobacteroides abscessus]|uniref:Helix-turn-helix domain-containing protein n=1 Tax=Mycobacteroides abscessus TaxID=36809 RepID=A0ABD7HG70_9MYCO|nr:helix-turn-helix domain-containing protein [Mycobacteroides abscessus]RIR87259.1 helix-turn-helix domain-containing protein [Mycobacteroides abscessus]RIT28088.1 helix-turn-helix domain-containing protein [Mycobacteroides abscessus]CPW28031.1 excisionase [Mycobacteroides abscessus]SLF48339.1 excisionase [Mycobacteroides abscessus subsp. bolletii]SLG69572.1 excisionase [Mycobacteroides abscessus subsp. abscessus]